MKKTKPFLFRNNLSNWLKIDEFKMITAHEGSSQVWDSGETVSMARWTSTLRCSSRASQCSEPTSSASDYATQTNAGSAGNRTHRNTLAV